MAQFTITPVFAMLIPLHKGEYPNSILFESNEGERTLLCSNKGGIRSPSLGLELERELSISDMKLLDQLAEILAESIIWHSKNGTSQ